MRFFSWLEKKLTFLKNAMETLEEIVKSIRSWRYSIK